MQASSYPMGAVLPRERIFVSQALVVFTEKMEFVEPQVGGDGERSGWGVSSSTETERRGVFSNRQSDPSALFPE